MLLLIIFIPIIIITLYWLFMSSYSQVFGEYIWHGPRDKKQIALTFDDGPNDPFTSEILDILKKHKVQATFFMVGKCIERNPDTAKNVLADGHIIANHSLSHNFFNYFRSLRMTKEIKSNQDIIYKYLRLKPALYRSPWLFRHPFILKNLKNNKLTPISGEFCHPFEVFHINGQKMANHVIKISKNGSIIIFHDGHDSKGGNRIETVKALPIVIKHLEQQGYSFVTIPEMLGIKAYN